MTIDARLRTLHQVTAAMLRSLDLEKVGQEIVRSARSLQSADAASLMLDRGDVLVIVAQDGLSQRYAESQRIPMARAHAMYRGPEVHLDIDLRASPVGDPALIREEGLARVLAVPLVTESALIGSLNVYTKDPAREFAPADVEVAHILAGQAAAAIANARLYEQALSAERFRSRLLESLGDGVIVARTDGTIVGANRAMREMLGVAEIPSKIAELRELVHMRGIDGTPVTDATSPFAAAFKGETGRGRFVFEDERTHEETIVDAVCTPVGAGAEVEIAIMAVHDVTASVVAEREREEFVSLVSHELKTPLTPLKALAQLIRARTRRSRQSGAPVDLDSLDRNLMTIERQVDRMNGLVNDLLEVSRAGRGTFRLHIEEVDLAHVVREMTQRYIDATSEEGRHRFAVDTPARLIVRGDQTRLEQVLWNLLGNAVKYSPRGGEVTVRLVDRDGAAVIEIADQGIGIDPTELDTLGRKPFSRGGGRAATFSGMGLGLYLTRIVAEGHGGALELRSEGEGKGTTARVTIPQVSAVPSDTTQQRGRTR